MEAILVKDQKAAAFVMEDGTFEGVYRITEKVCGDVEQVTGVRPKIIKWQGELQPHVPARAVLPYRQSSALHILPYSSHKSASNSSGD